MLNFKNIIPGIRSILRITPPHLLQPFIQAIWTVGPTTHNPTVATLGIMRIWRPPFALAPRSLISLPRMPVTNRIFTWFRLGDANLSLHFPTKKTWKPQFYSELMLFVVVMDERILIISFLKRYVNILCHKSSNMQDIITCNLRRSFDCFLLIYNTIIYIYIYIRIFPNFKGR